MDWRSANGVSWLETELGAARAAFSTRPGGVSRAPFESLNLGILTGDRGEDVFENRRRLATALGLPPSRVAIGRQVHGAALATHTCPQRGSPYAQPAAGVPEVDGHVTAEPGLAQLVFVADCLPIALAGEEAVAMLHCGWRGLAAGILERGVAATEATQAAIGPGIGACCYEVGEEVLEAFGSLGPGIADGRMLDLTEVATRLLRQAGVERVEAAALCTSCQPERFFSHRRDAGRTGRQAGLVWREGEAA
jgi:purine-nucleoside/S-methyl-5'-thioadenosine phosphorylase / adenosine deaminase